MSGHSKWHSIKHKKAATDAKRGKIFTMHAKIIELAARSGGDPSMNPSLRAAILNAKADNVPNANIDRAVKKGTGEDKNGSQFEELTYEVMGPGGSAFMVDVLTDNRNRTLTNIRTLVQKNGGTLGASGSVAWKFEKVAYFLVKTAGRNPEEVELQLIDCGAEDLSPTAEGDYELTAAPDRLGVIREALEKNGFSIEKAELTWQAKDELQVTDEGMAKSILKLADLLEDDEDVRSVTSNVDFSEDLLAHLGE